MTGGFKIQGNAGITWGCEDLINATGAFSTKLSGIFDNRAKANFPTDSALRSANQPNYAEFNANNSNSTYKDNAHVRPLSIATAFLICY